MVIMIALGLAFSWWQAAETNAGPRVSATDTFYLSCTTWTGKEWTDLTARSARTPVLESPKGFRAYGEVKVVVKNGSCENTTTLHVASDPGSAFRIVYTKVPSASDGNGIRLVGWSPSGDKLLTEVNLWKYETDLGDDHVAVIYDTSTKTAKEIHALDQALRHHFGPDCEFEPSIEDWRTDQQVLVKISRTPGSEEYEEREQHFCVNEPRIFVYDLGKETIQADPRGPQKKN